MSTNSVDLTIPVIKIRQRENSTQGIYIGKIKATDLWSRSAERFKIDFYQRIKGQKDKGYQRPLSDKAVDKIKDFVIRETSTPLLPTAILVNSRHQLDFQSMDGCEDVGKLIVRETLYIIDGQHRFEAWKSMMEDMLLQKQFGDYELPIVILSGFEEIKEIEQFFIINSRQKRIKTDLAQRHLLMLSKNDLTTGFIPDRERWKLFATKIVDILNEQIDGVWNDKIILPNDSKNVRKAKTISQSSFVSSLRPFFIAKTGFFTMIEDGNPDSWAEIINKFWNIVKLYYKACFEHPHDYAMTKTVGVFSFHTLLNKVLCEYGPIRTDEAFDKVESLIAKASENVFDLPFWKSTGVSDQRKSEGNYAGAYSSAVGHGRIVAGIVMGQKVK